MWQLKSGLPWEEPRILINGWEPSHRSHQSWQGLTYFIYIIKVNYCFKPETDLTKHFLSLYWMNVVLNSLIWCVCVLHFNFWFYSCYIPPSWCNTHTQTSNTGFSVTNFNGNPGYCTTWGGYSSLLRPTECLYTFIFSENQKWRFKVL